MLVMSSLNGMSENQFAVAVSIEHITYSWPPHSGFFALNFRHPELLEPLV